MCDRLEQKLAALDLKAAIIEVLEERRDLVRDIIEEVLEEAGLVAAIDEGLQTETVSRTDILEPTLQHYSVFQDD